MTNRSLERRLAALESARTPDDGLYVIDIGEPDTDDGERVPFVDWQHDDGGVVIDIGGGNTVENTQEREKDMTA
jgi:hypothetical protein